MWLTSGDWDCFLLSQPWGSQIANKKDRLFSFYVKFGNLCKAVKYHWFLPPILNQEKWAEENLNCSDNIFSKWWLGIIFNFSFHYKPGTENVLADSLSRYPPLQECNLEQNSQHLNLGEIKSAFDAVVNQVGNNKTWIAAVNAINTVFSDIENQILYDVGDQKTTLAYQDLAKYQKEERWIHLAIQFKKKEKYPDKHAYKQWPRESKILLREWDNLQVHEDILYLQKQQQLRQLILPSKLKALVYNELHVTWVILELTEQLSL